MALHYIKDRLMFGASTVAHSMVLTSGRKLTNALRLQRRIIRLLDLNQYADALDAPEIQRGWIARPVHTEWKSGQGQGSKLAPRSKRHVQFDHAPLQPNIGGSHW
jgi:hypothetical protein